MRSAPRAATSPVRDEEYRRRLQDKFGNRWRMKSLIQAKATSDRTKPVKLLDETAEAPDDTTSTNQSGRRKWKKSFRVLHKKAQPDGPDDGVERDVAVDVPATALAGRMILRSLGIWQCGPRTIPMARPSSSTSSHRSWMKS